MVFKREIEERQREKNAFLQASEVPYYKQKKTIHKREQENPIKRFEKAKDFLKTDSETCTSKEKKINLLVREEDSMLLMTSMIEEYVEENEILNREMDPKKTSFRIKTRKNERRYSRIRMGRELAVSKSQAVNVRWGVNLD